MVRYASRKGSQDAYSIKSVYYEEQAYLDSNLAAACRDLVFRGMASPQKRVAGPWPDRRLPRRHAAIDHPPLALQRSWLTGLSRGDQNVPVIEECLPVYIRDIQGPSLVIGQIIQDLTDPGAVLRGDAVGQRG
jgi:hypothetical protein